MHTELAAVQSSLYNVIRANRVIASVIRITHCNRPLRLVAPWLRIRILHRNTQRIASSVCRVSLCEAVFHWT